MSGDYIHENFLLLSKPAVELYHGYAKELPILDYHCHLPPQEIAEDRRFENLTQIWLAGDHYKWRALRAAGVDERWITGEGSDREKFQKWAEVVPQTLRNPLYHWTHLELKRPFGISDRLLNAQTADGIWKECGAKLSTHEFSTQGILRQMNVEVVCTTDDPTDRLEHHLHLANDASFPIKVLPTFRPDMALAVNHPDVFNAWIEKLSEASDLDIQDDYGRFLDALHRRHDFFHARGCRLSDHGLETFYADDYLESEAVAVFRRVRRGNELRPEELSKFRSAVLHELAVMNFGKGWTQQFHFGVLRNTNTRIFRTVGPNAGCDTIGDFSHGPAMARFFDRLDFEEKLARSILYNINPADNDLIATMIGNFQDGRTPGKMQFGSGWWFLDQKDGMENQLRALSSQGLLSRFVGMTTDSRSFLSFTRHEYFRRILCNLLGQEIQDGLLPRDIELIGSLVRDVCYFNAKRYFNFP